MKRVAKKLKHSLARGQGEVKRGLSRLVVTRMPRQAQAQQVPLGRLHAGPLVLACALGRAGITRQAGRRSCDTGGRVSPSWWLFSGGSSRAARWVLPMRRIRPSDGWCDDPGSAAYNRQVSLPCRGSHEKLWRADRLYDLVIVLDYNIHPRRKYRGSAIFLHCARPDFAPTEGCVALRPDDLRRLLPRLAKKVRLTIR